MARDRVLLIAPAPYDFDRGKSIRIRQSVQHLSALGFTIDVLAYPSGRNPEHPHVYIERPWQRLATDPAVPGVTWESLLSNGSLLVKAVRALRNQEYAVIHAHDIDGAIIAMLARFLARSEVPWVYDMHGAFSELAEYYALPLPSRLVRRIEQQAYDRSAHVILNWPHLHDLVSTRTETTLIMDQPAITVQDALGEPQALDTPWADDPYILYTGNYAPYQGVDLLLAAFEQLVADESLMCDPQLVLTGDPDESSIVEHEAIHYVGFVSERTLAALHQHAAVLVSPRLTEGFPPMKILYYLLTDIPIVATNKSCHKSVLTGYEGVIFAEPSPDPFAKSLREALRMVGPITRDAPFGDQAERYRDIYESLLNG